jgi:hypothetical protein
MSSYLPPTQDLDKFNPVVFPDGDDTGITLGEADARYVKKSGSIMTGALSVPNVSITNNLTLQGEDVGTKLDQIDTNTSNISNNSTAITTLQNKTTDLTYDSGTDTSTFSGKLTATDDATFSNTLDAVVNIKSGSSVSNDAFLKFFNAGIYKGGIYSSTDGIIINSYKVGSNFPEIQFRFEDGVISNVVLEITDSNIIINEALIPSINGLFELGSSSKFFSKLYTQDIETQNYASIDTAITTNITNISNNSSSISTNITNISNNTNSINTLNTKTQYLSTSGSGSSTKSSFSSSQLELISNYASSIIIKADENNDSGTEGAHIQMFVDTTFQGELTTLGSGLILSSHSAGAVKSIFLRFIENSSTTHNSIEFNQTNSIFDTNIIPKTDLLNDLGSTLKYWNHAYINNISTSSFSDLNTTLGGISTNSTNITALQNKTQDLTQSSGNYFLNTNLFEISAENTGDCVLRLRSDQDNNDSTDIPMIAFSREGTDDKFTMGFNSNKLEFKSFYAEQSNSDNFVFYVNDTITKFKIGDHVVSNAQFICQDIVPQTNNSKSIGTSTKSFLSAFINDITTTNHISIDTDITNLETKTQDLTQSSGDYFLATNLLEINAGNGGDGDCVLRLRSDQDNTDENDNCFIKFSQDGTTDRFSMGFNDNSLQFISYYVSSSTNDNFQFLVNTTDLRLEIGTDIEAHTKFISHEIEPDGNGTRALGTSSKRFTTSYINDITTSNHTSIDTDITNLETKTQYISVSGTDTILSSQSIFHENNDSVYFVLNGDKDNNNATLGSYLTLYAHNIFNGYLGTIGTFLDLHSFSAGTVKPIKFTFQDSIGTHTSLSCDDVDIKFNVNILPEITNTFSIGASGNIFSTSYFDNIITSSHNVNSTITSLNNKTQNISGTSTTTTIDGNFLDVNAQLDLPNNNDVDTLLSFFGSSITTLQTEMDAVEGKTAGLIANGSNTESTGQLIVSYNTDDSTIDWGLIEDGRTAVQSFKPSIFLDTNERDCYIGVVTESGNTTAGVGISYNAGAGDDPNMAVYFASNNQAYFRSHINSGHVKPAIDDNYDIGAIDRRWDDVYATNATIQTSDERQKTNIESLDETEMKEFISKLNAVKYIYNEKTRFHCGLIAQEVKEQMPFDFGLFIHNEEADSYGLRYTELIAPMISTIQNLIKENNNLKKENENIKNRLDIIEQLLGIE